MHEQSITIEMDGRFYNLPGVINGKFDPETAVQLFKQGKLRPLGQATMEPHALEMATERSHSFDHQQHTQAPQQTLAGIVAALQAQAQPRPDLITPGSTGSLENVRPYTYAGRVGTGPMKLSDMLQRAPTESPDAEGMGGPASLAMAKVFKQGPSLAARMAGKGATPVTELEKMFPALIDETSGDVIHAMKATGPGGHKALYEQAGTLKNFKPTRGFLDPATFDAFTEAQLEAIMAKRAGF